MLTVAAEDRAKSSTSEANHSAGMRRPREQDRASIRRNLMLPWFERVHRPCAKSA